MLLVANLRQHIQKSPYGAGSGTEWEATHTRGDIMKPLHLQQPFDHLPLIENAIVVG